MKAASALIRSAESQGITLWVEGGQLRYKARKPVSDGLKDRIREHKADIINLLKNQPAPTGTSSAMSIIPEWCTLGCECCCKLEFPDLPVVHGCYMETDERNWKWSRHDTMTACPRAKTEQRSRILSGD